MTKKKTTNKAIKSILIANRGEIASRVIRTCKEMGIRSIAVYSEADRNALFVKEADESIFIGESAPSASYLDTNKIINAAKKSNADAIHPGYGFLSENAEFAKQCANEDIIFIGPNPAAVASMGSKMEAKKIMEKSKVPIVPGYHGKSQQEADLVKAAEKIGYPLLLKATAGGGGKGMRIVHDGKKLKEGIAAAKREAQNAFSNDELIMEKYVSSGRHIEFQIFGDQHGNVIHLLERECTIQRRYQKVIEESPSPIMTKTLRKKMGDAAVKAAKALNYDNAGTVEFIYDDDSGDFYFLEVNTRLQVEHPVTEMITGLDLVKMQIESAEGKELSLQQSDIQSNGYAVECRLYAEDPDNDFTPVTGKVLEFSVPQNNDLRVESAIESNSEISVFYDPMIAKLIQWGNTRSAAHRSMAYVLNNTVCLGTKTNQQFLSNLFDTGDFNDGKYDTHFIEKNESTLLNLKKSTEQHNIALIACTLFNWQKRESARKLLKTIPSGWRNNFNDYQKRNFKIDDEAIEVNYRYTNNVFEIKINDTTHQALITSYTSRSINIEIDGRNYKFNIAKNENDCFVHNAISGPMQLTEVERFPLKTQEGESGGYVTPMPSQIIKVMVKQGTEVKKGDALVVISSMKMENTLEANEAGVVEEIYVEEGENVPAKTLLIKIKS